jgi:cell division septal protein FtsQ
MTIAVQERVPVAAVQAGGQVIAVDAAGLLLRGTSVTGLPRIPLRYIPGGVTLQAAGGRAALAALAAAPYRLLTHIASATTSAAHGVIVQMRSGPQLYFGDQTQLAQKWQAALAVLAQPSAAGAAYIDVSDPAHAAAGTG